MMNSNWIKVFLAAFFEVFWVIGLKHADNVWEWIGTVISIFINFYMMIKACRTLPVGTCMPYLSLVTKEPEPKLQEEGDES
jgi:paired small multidrug resistance pump